MDPVRSETKVTFVRQLWRERLRGVQRHVEVWQSLFSVRSLVVPAHEDVDNWLRFAALCRKSGRVRQSQRMLLQLLRWAAVVMVVDLVDLGQRRHHGQRCCVLWGVVLVVQVMLAALACMHACMA